MFSTMMLAVLFCILIVVVVVQVLRLTVSDCDLTLQWASMFGRKVESLKGQVVWITGASSGIGEALAYRLAAAGCKLVLSARRMEELDRVKKQCLLTGPLQAEDVLVLPLDMVQYESHAPAVQRVLQYFGQIDILVNNAGRSQRALFASTSLEVDRQMLELNVLGVLSLTKCVLPHMQERKKGHVVVTSSLAGKMGVPNSASYNGSKHALHGFFEALRIEGHEDNIDVTLLCPGPVFSNFLETAFTDTPGKVFGGSVKSDEKRMSAERCAQLSAVAIANKVDEAWISLHPALAFVYVAQFMPTLFRRMGKRIGLKQATKMREGQQ